MGRRTIAAPWLALLAALGAGSGARAQVRAAAVRSAPRGLALELRGSTQGYPGQRVQWVGAAYGVREGAELAPREGVELSLVALEGAGAERPLATARSDARGRFALDFAFARRVRLRARAGEEVREEDFSLEAGEASHLAVLLDRVQYEPGETLHLWVHALDPDTRAPLRDREVRVRLAHQGGGVSVPLESAGNTGASGMAYLRVPLPETLPTGGWSLEVSVGERREHRSFTLGRRVAQPMTAEVLEETHEVTPGGEVRFALRVRDSQGQPVPGAVVEAYRSEEASSRVASERTDAQGQATLRWQAPSYLQGSSDWHSVSLRVRHEAWGVVSVQRSYVVARVPWELETVPGRGGLVPGARTPWFLAVHTLGTRAPVGDTPVLVQGASVPGGRWQGRTDRHGVAELALLVAEDASATHTQGSCSNQVATTVEVRLGEGDATLTRRLCVPVASAASVLVSLDARALEPGATLAGRVERTAASRGRPVRLTLEHHRAVLASRLLEANEERFTWALPAGLQGVVSVGARPERRDASLEGAGTWATVLVRPPSVRATLAADRPRYEPGQRVGLDLRSAGVQGPAWAALVVRDVVARAGETSFELDPLGDALDRAAADPATPEAERLLGLALATLESADEPGSGLDAAALEEAATQSFDEASALRAELGRGVLLDPWRARTLWRASVPGEVLRAVERGLERALQEGDGGLWTGTPRRFHPELVERLVAAGVLEEDRARDLGGAVVRWSAVSAVAPEATFDRVARRVARARLVGLLSALEQVVDPGEDRPNPLATEPPERWLSWLVAHGRLDVRRLRDPWGGVFALRTARGAQEGGQPALSAALRGLRIASPGPDGRWDTADDVTDPRERVVPEGSYYARASGEEQLLRRLASLDPGQPVLHAMEEAYARVGRGAREEAVGDVARANDSEAEPAALSASGAAMLRSRSASAPMVRASGAGMGGGGMGYGSGAGRGVLGGLSARVRQRFPATLWAVGATPLDAQGGAHLEFPLADAVSTYRANAVLWSAAGQAANAETSFVVSQDVVVDAPIPRFASSGDELVLPVRLQNLSAVPQAVTLLVQGRDGVQARALEPSAAQPRAVAPGATEVFSVRLRLEGAGAGAVRLEASVGGRAVDRLERPLVLWAEGRPVRREAQGWGLGAAELELEVPAEARDQGLGVVRVTQGAAALGPEVGEAPAGESSLGALLRRAQGRELGMAWLQRVHEAQTELRPRTSAAVELGVLWDLEESAEEDLEALLQRVVPRAPREGSEASASTTEAHGAALSVLALTVAAQGRARPALAGALQSARAGLLRELEAEVVSRGDRPEVVAAAALALAFVGGSHAERARELLRRVRREMAALGPRQWVAVREDRGPAVATAEVALAAALLGEGELAQGCLQWLAEEHLDAGAPALRLGQWAVLRLERGAQAAGQAARGLTWRVDGAAPQRLRVDAGLATATSAELRRPGLHRVRVEGPAGALLRVQTELHFARPWGAGSEGPFALALEGEAGRRDAVTALTLTVRNRTARLLRQPVVLVELPAGAELEASRVAALRRAGLLRANVAGRTLTLAVRPLGPGAQARFALPVRWSLEGRLRGLGVAAYTSEGLGAAVSELAPRVLEVGPAER